MKCLYISVAKLCWLIVYFILVIFSLYFPHKMSNAVLLCHILFRLSPLIWHALSSNLSLACFLWCSDFEESYHMIIYAAWSHNYLVCFLLILDLFTGLFFFSIFDMCPYMTMIWIFLVLFGILWFVLTNCVRFWCTQLLDILHFLSGIKVFIFEVRGEKKNKHKTYI